MSVTEQDPGVFKVLQIAKMSGLTEIYEREKVLQWLLLQESSELSQVTDPLAKLLLDGRWKEILQDFGQSGEACVDFCVAVASLQGFVASNWTGARCLEVGEDLEEVMVGDGESLAVGAKDTKALRKARDIFSRTDNAYNNNWVS